MFRSIHLVDHINGQPLDDRKANLRWSTTAANTANRIPWSRVPTLDQIVARLMADAGVLAEVPF